MAPIDFKSIPVGLYWCREEDYESFLSILEDASDLPKTWHGFIARMEKVEHSFEEGGQAVRRININPRTFPRWCAVQGKRIDTDACQKFAADIAIKEHRNTRGGDL